MNNSTKTILGAFIGLILLAGAFSGGFIVGHLMPATGQVPVLSDFIPGAPGVLPEQQAATPDELETLFVPFWEAWNVVHDQHDRRARALERSAHWTALRAARSGMSASERPGALTPPRPPDRPA